MALPLSERMLVALGAIEGGCRRHGVSDLSTAFVAAALGLSPRTTLRTLQALERRGLVEQAQSPGSFWRVNAEGRSLLGAVAVGAANMRLIKAQKLDLPVRSRPSGLAERAAA